MPEYADLIGIPYKLGGRGPNEYDCYGLLMELHRRQGNTIPDYRTPEGAGDLDLTPKERVARIGALFSGEVHLWKKVEPHVGASIMFSIRGYGAHCGMLVAPDRFLHTWEGTGSVTKERLSFGWQHRILGYYDYVG